MVEVQELHLVAQEIAAARRISRERHDPVAIALQPGHQRPAYETRCSQNQ